MMSLKLKEVLVSMKYYDYLQVCRINHFKSIKYLCDKGVIITFNYLDPMSPQSIRMAVLEQAMTMWCNKLGRGLFKVLYFIGKLLGLFAFNYDFKDKVFLGAVPATVMSSVICIIVAVVSPILFKLNADVFLVSGVNIDETMSVIIGLQCGLDFVTSFVVLLCQLWKREHVIRSANDFQKICKQLSSELGCSNIITPEIILLIAMKLSITMYEALINFPYLIEYSHNIGRDRIVGMFLTQYIAVIAPIFSDITFVALLLLARYFDLVNELFGSLKVEIQTAGVSQKTTRRLRRLMRMYRKLRRMVADFSGIVETSIFVQILNSFTNLLSNLYALLDFYAAEKNLNLMSLIYTVMIFWNICLLIHAAERVKQRSSELKDNILDIDAGSGPEWRSDALVFEIWPEVSEVYVLGMFSLNNMFLLFLITYASNFVVIILQTQLTKLPWTPSAI